VWEMMLRHSFLSEKKMKVSGELSKAFVSIKFYLEIEPF